VTHTSEAAKNQKKVILPIINLHKFQK